MSQPFREGKVMKIQVNFEVLDELLDGVQADLSCVRCPAWDKCNTNNHENTLSCRDTLMNLLTKED